MNQDEIGKFICKLRGEHGWTQEDLANKIPVTRQAVSRWEQGKSIPDSSTLIILSEIFDVSINELLSGKRIPKKELKNEVEKITLEMVDKNISNQNKIKKIIIISISLIMLFIFGFLFYYFFATYDSVKVYSIDGKSDNFFSRDGIMIITKQKLYFKLSKLECYDDYEIDKVKLSFKKGNNKILIYENEKEDILISEEYGYEEYFYYNDLEYIIKGMTLEIYYDDKVDKMNLKLNLKMSNDKFVFNKNIIGKNKVKDNSRMISKRENSFEDDIVNFMKTNGKLKNETYVYKVDNKVFYYSDTGKFIIERIEGDIKETWNFDFNSLYIEYNKLSNSSIISKCYGIISNNKITKNTDIYERFFNYVDRYIYSKSN